MSKHMEAAATTQPELFFWERPELDFPLYDDETMGLWQPILLIGSAVAALVSLSFLPDSRMVKSAALFLGPLVPYLIVARGNIFTIIKRPRLGDIILVPVTLILTIAYSLGMGILLYKLGFEIQGNAVYNETRDAVFFASLFVQLFGEEMVKLNIFLGVLILAFKRTGNRKMSVVAAVIITLFIFGIAHFRAYNGSLVQILLIQGAGSIFALFCYMRSKNILTSYAMHFLQDFLFLI